MDEEFVYYFPDGRVMGRCSVRMFVCVGSVDFPVIVFTEIPTNTGKSVTNAIEYIVSQFCSKNGLNQEDALIIERYLSHPNDLDLVTIAKEYGEETPSWRRLTDEEATPILIALNGQ